MATEKKTKSTTETAVKTEPAKTNGGENGAFAQAMWSAFGKKEVFFQFFDAFQIPVEIFAADGTTVYVNQACMDMSNIKDPNLLVGKYNLRTDPVCNDHLGFREEIQRGFRGEPSTIKNFPAPIQDVLDRGVIDEKPWESAYMDVSLSPVWDNGKFVYTVCTFIVKYLYQGRREIVKAREYIEKNWLDEFDLKAIAKAASLNSSYFSRLFKQQVGESVFEYYKKIKVRKLKEKLLDPSLNITEAFAACGVDYTGRYAGYFHEIVGISPSEYRKDKLKKE